MRLTLQDSTGFTIIFMKGVEQTEKQKYHGQKDEKKKLSSGGI